MKTNSLKTEIALRSKQEEIRNQLEVAKKQNFRDVSNENGPETSKSSISAPIEKALFSERQNNTNSNVDSPMKMLFEKARKKSIGRSKISMTGSR